jgi:hypothetical protein
MAKIAMVSGIPLQRLPIAQQERLLYIDMRLRFLGEIRRQDLIHRFAIQTAAATRDLALYRNEASENLNYVSQTKSYVRSDQFVPLYDHVTAQDALGWLSPGSGESGLLDPEVRLPIERPVLPGQTSVEVLEMITLAIKRKAVVEVLYLSPFIGSSKRLIVPHALADIQGNWLVRAFDRTTQAFANFRLSSIKEATIRHIGVHPLEQPARDASWATRLTLELRPHPKNVEHPQCLERQVGSPSGIWRTEIRAPLVDEWLDRLGVDTTKNHRLHGQQFVWWLRHDPRSELNIIEPSPCPSSE